MEHCVNFTSDGGLVYNKEATYKVADTWCIGATEASSWGLF